MKRTIWLLTLLVIASAIVPAETMAQESEAGGYAILSKGKNTFVGLNVGWVAKDWVTSRKGRTYHEDLWGNPDRMLNGFQIGLNVQHDVWCGIGFRTGFKYEWYTSVDRVVKDAGFKRFGEHNLYFPIHASFHLSPLKHFSITPYAGIGFNWAMNGVFHTYDEASYDGPDYWDWKNNPIGSIISSIVSLTDNANLPSIVCYDYNNHSPHHWNVQAEVGVSVQIYAAELSFTYSFGVNRHNIYEDAATKQNKMTATIGFLLSTSKKY